MSAVFRAARNDFDRLYRRHVASVYRYAYAVVGNHADAEDVTQQTFLNAYRALSEGTKPRKAENWLLTIAHNEVRKHFRRVQAKPLEVELDEEVADHAAERSEPSLTEVVRALQHLPPLQRSALVMREFEGRSYKEIAQILEVTQSALETMVFRARRALAEQLEGALSCAEAERAVSQRLDGRLPRPDARRLKAHLRDCPLCVRYADVQKRQRSLLRGFSIMPIPASLFLFRGEHATAAGLGASAAAAGGSGTLGGGGLAGFATGFAAKAAALTATVGVAGGVGYTAVDRPEAVRSGTAPNVAEAAAGAEQRQGAIVNVAVPTRRSDRPRADRPSRADRGRRAGARNAHQRPASHGEKARVGKARAVAHPATVPPVVRDTRPAALKPARPRALKAKRKPPAGKATGHLKPTHAKPAGPAKREQAKPPVDPGAHPQPPHAGGRGPKN